MKVVKPAQGKLLEHYQYVRRQLIDSKILLVNEDDEEQVGEKEDVNGKNVSHSVQTLALLSIKLGKIRACNRID